MKYKDFLISLTDSKIDICKGVYDTYKDTIKIKKEKTVIKNLEKIFDATLKIGIEKGFQAMTMRDLGACSGLSMGALYSYFSSKEEILKVFLGEGRKLLGHLIVEMINKEKEPVEKLAMAVKAHLFLSEKMHRWFYFSYMEAKNLNRAEKENAIQSELYTEKLIEEILIEGHQKNLFKDVDHSLAASVIKAMLQDWYLKRGKYAKRKVDVDQYAEFLITFINAFYLNP